VNRGKPEYMRATICILLIFMWVVTACTDNKPTDFELDVSAFDRGDYATALKEFLPLAEQGNAKAQLYLGRMYYNGWGVPEDLAQAGVDLQAAQSIVAQRLRAVVGDPVLGDFLHLERGDRDDRYRWVRDVREGDGFVESFEDVLERMEGWR